MFVYMRKTVRANKDLTCLLERSLSAGKIFSRINTYVFVKIWVRKDLGKWGPRPRLAGIKQTVFYGLLGAEHYGECSNLKQNLDLCPR